MLTGCSDPILGEQTTVGFRLSVMLLHRQLWRFDNRISPDSLTITSYDKPLRSMRETFFVTNNHRSMTMLSITLQFTYRRHDNGAMLHSRTATIAANIPPGETRQLYVTSWDRQYSYYHHATRIRPRSPKAVAYDTDISAISAAFGLR